MLAVPSLSRGLRAAGCPVRRLGLSGGAGIAVPFGGGADQQGGEPAALLIGQGWPVIDQPADVLRGGVRPEVAARGDELGLVGGGSAP